MKKLILLLSIVIGLSAMANAQTIKKAPEQRANQMAKVLRKKLNLNPNQANHVYSALLNQAIRMDSLSNNLSTNQKSNSLTRRSIVIDTEKQIFAVLNDNQKQKFIQLQKMRKEKRIEKKDGNSTVQY